MYIRHTYVRVIYVRVIYVRIYKVIQIAHTYTHTNRSRTYCCVTWSNAPRAARTYIYAHNYTARILLYAHNYITLVLFAHAYTI